MSSNRSMPPSDVIPELPYPDVREAVNWLCRAFGFQERLQIGDHRSQLVFGGGSIVVTKRSSRASPSAIMVRVEDADEHYAKSKEAGAKIVSPPADYPYGERQYTAEDIGGHIWTFSQTIADIDPQSWGCILFD